MPAAAGELARPEGIVAGAAEGDPACEASLAR